MSNYRSTVACALAALALSSCGTSDPAPQSMAETTTFTDQWASAADAGDMGMAAVFGTVTNTGEQDVRIVAGDSPVAGRVEVHEVAPDASGTAVMRPKDGGIVIAAGTSADLVPGGDHLMLMELTESLRPGADVTLTVLFEDGSSADITAQVRDFVGADEEYAPTDSHQHG